MRSGTRFSVSSLLGFLRSPFTSLRSSSGRPDRARRKSAAVVVVRVEVIPDDRLAAEQRAELANVGQKNLARDNLGSGPENVDLRQEIPANSRQIVRTAEAGLRHASAIGCGAEDEPRLTIAAPDPRQNAIRDVALSRCQRDPAIGIAALETARGVIEEQREMPAAKREQLIEPPVQPVAVGFGTVTDVEARAEAEDEMQSARVAGLDQALESGRFFIGARARAKARGV